MDQTATQLDQAQSWTGRWLENSDTRSELRGTPRDGDCGVLVLGGWEIDKSPLPCLRDLIRLGLLKVSQQNETGTLENPGMRLTELTVSRKTPFLLGPSGARNWTENPTVLRGSFEPVQTIFMGEGPRRGQDVKHLPLV